MAEKEWVDRKALVEEIREAQRRLESCDDFKWERNKPYFKGLAWAHRIVLDAPAADVVEVVHARWINPKNGNATCSHCGFRQRGIYDDDNEQNFCGVCGAKMDGGKNDDK